MFGERGNNGVLFGLGEIGIAVYCLAAETVRLKVFCTWCFLESRRTSEPDKFSVGSTRSPVAQAPDLPTPCTPLKTKPKAPGTQVKRKPLEFIAYILADGFATVVTEALTMIAMFLAPFVVFALIIHWLEGVTQRQLASRFGWHSVLWTGWLGTPIHELSHVAMCVLFRHRVDEVALFEPDRGSGRLGYVRHSFRSGNWFEEIGNLFVGIAPLLGGSLALAVLLWLFYPSAAVAAIETTQAVAQSGGIVDQTWRVATQFAGEILSLKNLGTVRFWIFLYLVLCVGSHMAPSSSDYQGASRGVLLAGGLLLGVTLLLAFAGVELNRVIAAFVGAAGPLFAILGLTVLLCGVSTAVVYLLTSLIPQRYSVG